MPFIRVPYGGSNAKGAEQPHAADAQQNFLAKPHLLVASVEASGQCAVLRCILGHICIDQVQRDAAYSNSPDHRCDIPPTHIDVESAGLSRRCQCGMDWRVFTIEGSVRRFLPSFRGNALSKIPLRIHEADPDDRHA